MRVGQLLGAARLLSVVEGTHSKGLPKAEGEAGHNGLPGTGRLCEPSSSLAHVQARQSHDQSLDLASFASWLFVISCDSLGKLINLSGPQFFHL